MPPESNSYDAAAAHYQRQAQQNEHQAQPIETIYTTVESDPDRTDWLTAVSNLRQINRQLVEEIARLEQALASTKQSLHTHKEQNQSHEITILQQQGEIGIAHDRLGAIFQQLETSHQIGQRQQTLIETLSQQLEIVQTIVPQLEAEHEELTQKYQQQSQKLTKTEQVAVELHRRLQLLDTTKPEYLAAVKDVAEIDLDLIVAEILVPEVEDQPTETMEVIEITDHQPDQTNSELDSCDASPKFDPAPPRSPLQIAQSEIARWTPSAPTAPSTWRPEMVNTIDSPYSPTFDDSSSLTTTSTEVADKESSTDDPSLNWPAPTHDPDQSTAKKIKIDLPRFPKKSTK